MSTITLVNGASTLTVDLDTDADECSTLAEVLDLFRETVNIPAGSTVSVDGETVNPEDVSVDDLPDGADVVATKTTGSKG